MTSANVSNFGILINEDEERGGHAESHNHMEVERGIIILYSRIGVCWTLTEQCRLTNVLIIYFKVSLRFIN